jgi:poly-gamma-glutamate synthesis protein (capsule biosynthesis protein)
MMVLPAEDLLIYAWDHQPSWAIVPFEALEPRWKVLEIDGLSPLQHGFDLTRYLLTVNFSIQSKAGTKEDSMFQPAGTPFTNREEASMATVMLTGVTALRAARL